jgi:hypothetical protein
VALETGKINGKEATELSTKLFFSWDIAEYVYCGGFILFCNVCVCVCVCVGFVMCVCVFW